MIIASLCALRRASEKTYRFFMYGDLIANWSTGSGGVLVRDPNFQYSEYSNTPFWYASCHHFLQRPPEGDETIEIMHG